MGTISVCFSKIGDWRGGNDDDKYLFGIGRWTTTQPTPAFSSLDQQTQHDSGWCDLQQPSSYTSSSMRWLIEDGYDGSLDHVYWLQGLIGTKRSTTSRSRTTGDIFFSDFWYIGPIFMKNMKWNNCSYIHVWSYAGGPQGGSENSELQNKFGQNTK